jgi:hypothetical protein
MPLNVMDAHYRSFGKLVLPELVKLRIGVLGMEPWRTASISNRGPSYRESAFATH